MQRSASGPSQHTSWWIGPSAESPPQRVTLARRFERNQTMYDWRHYVSLQERKPGGLRNGIPFKTMIVVMS